MIPDPDALKYIGDEWGFPAIVAFILIAAFIWLIREDLKRRTAETEYRAKQDEIRRQEEVARKEREDAELEYRRQRDDKVIATQELLIRIVSELSDHVNKLADERLWSVIQSKQNDTGD